jgi:hypothetical protein
VEVGADETPILRYSMLVRNRDPRPIALLVVRYQYAGTTGAPIAVTTVMDFHKGNHRPLASGEQWLATPDTMASTGAGYLMPIEQASRVVATFGRRVV